MDTPAPYQITLGYDHTFPPPPEPLRQMKDEEEDGSFIEGSNRSFKELTQMSTQDKYLRLENRHNQQHHQQQIYNSSSSSSSNKAHHQHHDNSATPPLIGSLMYSSPFVIIKDQSPSGSSSGSNRSSTISSNSSGYSGSCGQLPPQLKQIHRLSGQSSESGISTLSSQYVQSSIASSQSSLEKKDQGPTPQPNACLLRSTDPYQQGLKEAEALYSWLQEISQTDCYQLFLQSGYDKPTISRMTPEDLTAIGITVPTVRKKLTTEISKLHIPDGIPNYWPSSLKEWLNLLHLQKYQENLTREGYHNLEDVLQITWEDLEEIGIKKLGHQKKIILAIDKLKKIHSSKNLPQNTTELFNFTSTPPSSSKNRKRDPLSCHTLIADQITAKNKSKEIVTRKSPEIIHLNPAEIPAPEIVAIKVNRSWSAGQQEQEKPQKYESFHGSPSRDFKSLLRDASQNCEIFQSLQNTPTRFFESPPSPAPDSSLSSPVKMRPPQIAPKPFTRSRRASGGATIGISFEAEMLNSAVLKRQNSCQGSILAQFSPVGDSYNPTEIFQHPSTREDDVARNVRPDTSRWKKSTPPAPPKRTNSIKNELNTMTLVSDHNSCGSSNRETQISTDPSAKLPPLARGLSRNWSAQTKAVTSNQASSSLSSSSLTSSSSSPPFRSISTDKMDCNTLHFANENVGTIRQKIPTSESSRRPPVKPKPKLSSGSGNSSPVKQNSTTDKNCDSVFDDIDNMFQGLARELDDMLIG